MISERRNANALTYCRRASLAQGGVAPSLPLAFLRELRRQDRELELHWFHNHWILYRVAQRGTVRSEDFLMKELDILGKEDAYRPVGPWLLDWLRANDKTQGGSIEIGRANKNYIKRLDRQENEYARNKEKPVDDLARQFKIDVDDHAVKNKFTRSLKV